MDANVKSDAPPSQTSFVIQKRTRQSVFVIGLLFVALFLGAAIIPMGGAVIGTGQLSVESRVKRIAHPVGGVISQIRVRDGDRVKKGDLLVRLDTTVSAVTANSASRTVDQLLAQRTRLTSELEGRDTLQFPASLSARTDGDARAAMQSERRLFSLRRTERNGLRSQLRQRVVQLQKQIDGYQAQISSLQKQQILIEPERKGVDELWQKGLVTINRRNQLERTAADLEGSIAALQASIAGAKARITETREQIIQIGQSARADAATELAQINNSLNTQQAKNISASDTLDRSEIRAPYAGVIDKMVFASVDDVIQPAQTIMEIVPDSDQLVVEAQIRPADIDQVQKGQMSRVHFTSYASPQTPVLEGQVAFVSAERTTERETGASYYRARIALDPKEIEKRKLSLIAGMPVDVFIATGSRSMLSYLTKPLSDQFSRAFRD